MGITVIVNPSTIYKVTFAINPHSQVTSAFSHAKQTLSTGSFYDLII